jgi:dihydrofolate synthase/folylpolyglutamate synthase
MKKSTGVSDTLEYLYSLQGRGIKLGLDNPLRIMDFCGNPHQKLASVHIAGTNGKGSVAAGIASILQNAGYRVGLYTSPHLVRFSERIKVNGRRIPDDLVVEKTEEMREFIERHQITFFEAATAMAFSYFAERSVDIAVIETGLGGRLDATNVVHPDLSIITSISMDHQRFLGHSLKQITREKAGIIKDGVPVITCTQADEVLKVIRYYAQKNNAPLTIVDPSREIIDVDMGLEWMKLTVKDGVGNLAIRTDLVGECQVQNIALIYNAVKKLERFPVTIEQIKEGLLRVQWLGRFQLILRNPMVLYDVAHNPSGVELLMKTLLRLFPDKKKRLVFALLQNKQAGEIAEKMLSVAAHIYIGEIDYPRAMKAEDIAVCFPPSSSVSVHHSIEDALNEAVTDSNTDDVICVFGSHYFAEEIYSKKYLTFRKN